MPAPLTENQRLDLIAALHDLQAELRGQLTLATESARVVDLDQPIGRVSRIDAIQQQKMAVANRHSLQVRLERIRAAFAADERDEYGECRECEEDIGYDRLRARPESPLCIGCQQELEALRRR